jgi:hypothetical protein
LSWNFFKSRNSDYINGITIYKACASLGIDQPSQYSDFECDEAAPPKKQEPTPKRPRFSPKGK